MKSAEAFMPGVYLRDELEEREWTSREFVDQSGLDYLTVLGLISGAIAITPEYAAQIAAAFGTSPELWLNLQACWDARHPTVTPNAVIPNEAKLHEKLVNAYRTVLKDLRGEYVEKDLEFHRGYVQGVREMLREVYGPEVMERVCDDAIAASNRSHAGVRVLSGKESRALFEEQARRAGFVSADAFLTLWNEGAIVAVPDVAACRELGKLVAMFPFAEAGGFTITREAW